MKMIVTKEELLDFCSKCAEICAQGKSCDVCPFSAECSGAYIDFWRDNTEVIQNEQC